MKFIKLTHVQYISGEDKEDVFINMLLINHIENSCYHLGSDGPFNGSSIYTNGGGLIQVTETPQQILNKINEKDN